MEQGRRHSLSHSPDRSLSAVSASMSSRAAMAVSTTLPLAFAPMEPPSNLATNPCSLPALPACLSSLHLNATTLDCSPNQTLAAPPSTCLTTGFNIAKQVERKSTRLNSSHLGI